MSTVGIGGPVGPQIRSFEWPTLLVAGAVYLAFGFLTWFHESISWWALLPLAGYTVALHGSLQHETVHGHPTRWRWLNELIVLPSLWLWLPFRLYRQSHLDHHRDPNITDPALDPESFYVTEETWQRLTSFQRASLWVRNTVAGRLLIHPLYCMLGYVGGELAQMLRGRFANLGAWGIHLVGCALVLGWAIGICGMSFWEYLAFFVYPGLSLTLLRSFLEHQARHEVAERTVVVEAGPLMSLLYLNNNLHALHHAEPGLPWYRLPARYQQRRAELLAASGNYCYPGYLAIVLRYLLWPKERPVHPANPVQPESSLSKGASLVAQPI